jgi:hypothetical protein
MRFLPKPQKALFPENIVQDSLRDVIVVQIKLLFIS